MIPDEEVRKGYLAAAIPSLLRISFDGECRKNIFGQYRPSDAQLSWLLSFCYSAVKSGDISEEGGVWVVQSVFSDMFGWNAQKYIDRAIVAQKVELEMAKKGFHDWLDFQAKRNPLSAPSYEAVNNG
jgi:hypothetical protein